MSNPNMNPNPQSGGQDDAQTSRYFDNPYGYPYGYPYGPGQPNPNDSNGEWKPVSPFKLMESWLPQRAKNAIRGAYGIIGVIAIVLGLALLIWPGATLKIAAIALGASRRSWNSVCRAAGVCWIFWSACCCPSAAWSC